MLLEASFDSIHHLLRSHLYKPLFICQENETISCPTLPLFSQEHLAIQKHHGLSFCETDGNAGRIGFLEVIFFCRGRSCALELLTSWRLFPHSPRLLNVLDILSTVSTSL